MALCHTRAVMDFRDEWAHGAQWRLLATGWPAGHALLQAWHDWRADAHHPGHHPAHPGPASGARRPGLLHLACALPWPLPRESLLAAVPDHLQPLAQALAAQWWGLLPGQHRLMFDGGRVLFTVFVGPLDTALRETRFAADAIVLADPGADAPRDLSIVKALARLVRRGTLLVADHADESLRHDLRTAGFALETSPAGGPQAHRNGRLRARFAPAWTPRTSLPAPLAASRAIVIGGGLAGASAAASLARRGWQVDVLDAAPEPASGTSGLPAGLMAPHLTPDDNLLSRLSRAGIRITLAQARELLEEGRDWQGGGTLEHRLRARTSTLDAEGFAADWSRAATPAQRAAAFLPDDAPAAWHPQGGWICPGALVRAWLRTTGVTWRGGCRVERLARIGTADGGNGATAPTWQALDADGRPLAQAPLVVIAAALGSAPLSGNRLWLNPVRGQVSWAPQAPGQCLPPFPVNGNGHLLPDVPLDGQRVWMSGSSYGRGEADRDERPADHLANLERLQALVPLTAQQLAPDFAAGRVRGWTGVRCASGDRRPLVGPLDDGLWVSTAMGSRGLSFAALCGELLAARLHGEPLPLPLSLAAALDVARQLR